MYICPGNENASCVRLFPPVSGESEGMLPKLNGVDASLTESIRAGRPLQPYNCRPTAQLLKVLFAYCGWPIRAWQGPEVPAGQVDTEGPSYAKQRNE